MKNYIQNLKENSETKFTVIKGTLINGLARYSSAFINILFSAVLARILVPEDFGIVAVTTVFVNFFKTIADAGLGPAIIQFRNLDEKDINNIFSATLILGGILAVLTALCGWPVSIFYENDVYVYIFPTLAICTFFSVINTVPNALLLKKQQFKMVGMNTVLATLISCIFAVILAVNDWKYNALLGQSISYVIILFVLNLTKCSIKPGIRNMEHSLKKVGAYSIYQFAFNFINYFSRNLDNLLVGKILGTRNLAYYEKSYTLMTYPVQGMTSVITPVLHPVMANYQNDLQRIYGQYKKIVRLLSMAGIIISLLFWGCSSEIILILYGEQWKDAAECVRWLGVSAWAQMIVSATGTIYQSIGKTKLLLINGTIGAVIIVMSIVCGIYSGSIEIVALTVSGAYFLMVFLSHYIMMHFGFCYSFWHFIGEFVPDFIFIVAGCLFIRQWNFNGLHLLLQLFLKFLLIGILYIIYILSKRFILKKLGGRK